MKNILKILAVFLLLTGVVFATDYKEVSASHILVKTREEAVSIKQKLDEGGNFGYYARKYSLCPSGQNGGQLGYFKRGQMVKSFEDAAFSLPVGAVSDPIETQFGWHLIKVNDKR